MAIELPIELPIDILNQYKSGSIVLPIHLPMSFIEKGVVLPIILPMQFKTAAATTTAKTILLPYNEVAWKVSNNLLPYNETAEGHGTAIPFSEIAWKFNGLILDERILSTVSQDLTISENVQALVLADFELISANEVKISWYGNSVPSVIIMKKAVSDDTYKADKEYAWSVGSATTTITNEDYNIYLLGASNSGSSAIYTIAGINDTLVIPDVKVLLNEKIITGDINYTSKYELTINY